MANKKSYSLYWYESHFIFYMFTGMIWLMNIIVGNLIVFAMAHIVIVGYVVFINKYSKTKEDSYSGMFSMVFIVLCFDSVGVFFNSMSIMTNLIHILGNLFLLLCFYNLAVKNKKIY